MKLSLDQTLAQIYKLRRPFSTGPDGKASTFRTGLIDRCEQLLEMPLWRYQPSDLRVMLHQNFYPQTLVPLALPLIEHEPLADVELYPGDLLSSILSQSSSFWLNEPRLLERTLSITVIALADPGLPDSVRRDIEGFSAKINTPSFNARMADGRK